MQWCMQRQGEDLKSESKSEKFLILLVQPVRERII